MARLGLVVPALAAALCACATAKPQKPNPFTVPRETFYPTLKVVALAPLRVPGDLEDPDPVKARYADRITKVLVEAGLTVVPPSDVGPVIDAATKQIGGLFDPATGQLDAAKEKALDAAVGKELRARFNADAYLEPSVRVVQARLWNDEASWHGAHKGAGKGFWKAVLLEKHSGQIPALSLFVFLTDAQGARLYAKAGGIQVLGKVKLGGGFERRPRSELFAEEERVAGSVHLALDELLGVPEKVPADAGQ